jgi:hypothetical protein
MENDMRYNEFRNLLQDALGDAGLLFRNGDRPVEMIDLADTNRHWHVYIWRSGPQSAEPFNVSAKVSFDWSPVDTARAYTCEEDLLMELLGSKQRQMKTERRWVRVDLALYAGLPYGSTAPLPDVQVFGSWIALVSEKLNELLTEYRQRQQRIVAVIGACEEIEVETRCSPAGVLTIQGVSVSGFRLVRVPRVWDDPDRREVEKGIGEELVRLAGLFRAALDEWVGRIGELAKWIRYTPPPPASRPVEPWFEDEEEGENDGPGTIH